MSMHLFTTPDFGLANRLRGLVGAWAHAKHTGQTLDVLWTVSPACPYAIQDLFDPLPGTRYITEAHPPYSYESSDLGHLKDILAKHSLRVQLAPVLIASLKPVAALQERIRTLAGSIPFSECLGLHIRRTDVLPYAVSLGLPDPNPLEAFWALCDARPAVPLFLACDDKETVEACRARYGKRVHVAKEIPPSTTDKLRATDGEHAVLDLYCLALCKYFQGSRLSSFTTHVTYLREAWALSPSLRLIPL